ncbi:sodium-dependent serotonin transporter-like [Dreissena polymorpha]|uniref:Transporter n=1 Tax=Dreissena polymorpha TaxID=45954 RepID=A0A9D4MVD1_DREPO|nr:sodium-dependent serotonin transporter-like [Dreissena polymorpha]KAH3884493.1 hypothetical protein DPMN_008474 [Dreissena polymorpha]
MEPHTVTDDLLVVAEETLNETESQMVKACPETQKLLTINGYVVEKDAEKGGSVDVEERDVNTGVTPSNGENGVQRETWGNKIDFLLSVTGFAVDLGNVWRFPYICFKNGGGAFLIPYFIMLVFLGLPLFYMELALGQFHKSGAIAIWKKLCPMFAGAGVATCMVAILVGMYYNTIIAWALYYLVASFRSEVPWASCNNSWNSPDCVSFAHGFNASLVANTSVPSALEYFNYNVLESHKSRGIDDIGAVKWSLCLCLLGVMTTVYFALWKGIKSSGKAVWVTATAPYVILLVLLGRGATLPGAGTGILYYITPVWDRLLEVGVWIDAAAQVFFSLGPGFGTLLALSSYNKFNNNCYLDAMITAGINCFTSLLAGFVVFAVLGYMSHVLNISIDELALEGPGLVFYVYPEAIATISGSVFWAIIFFVLLITLGIDSTFGGLESVITALCDLSPTLTRHRKLVVLVVVVICFLGGLPSTTYGGQYVITLMDTHAAPVALFGVCLVEAISVSWIYGVQHFSNDIEKMLGFQPGVYWKICWSIICPIFLSILFVLSIVAYSGLQIEHYRFPAWSETVGWLVTSSSLVCIPAFIIIKFVITPGTITERLKLMIQSSSTDYPDNEAGFTLRNAQRHIHRGSRYVYTNIITKVFRKHIDKHEHANDGQTSNGVVGYQMTEIPANGNGHHFYGYQIVSHYPPEENVKHTTPTSAVANVHSVDVNNCIDHESDTDEPQTV